jgi:hypothetical protein
MKEAHMRRSFCFSGIAITLFVTIAACSSDDTTPAAAAGTGGTAGSGAGGKATGGTAGTAATGGTTGGGGATGTGGGARDASADVGTDHTVSAQFSFFVTSTGSADGGKLGGLSGADQKCQMLASAVGAGSKTWHAYLSLSSGGPDGGVVNARDRIGTGPWYNVNGELIATNIAALHEENDAGMNGINAATGLDENGNRVPVGGDGGGGTNQHDILTGSMPDGRAFPATPDFTCAGWTSNEAAPPPVVPSDAASDASDAAIEAAAEAAVDAALADATTTPGPRAYVGHVNRTGTNAPPANASWNSSHATPGCAQADLVRVGGAGRVYCFAVTP